MYDQENLKLLSKVPIIMALLSGFMRRSIILAYTISILIYAIGALQFIAAKMTVMNPTLGQKIRYIDGLNLILLVFSNTFLIEK